MHEEYLVRLTPNDIMRYEAKMAWYKNPQHLAALRKLADVLQIQLPGEHSGQLVTSIDQIQLWAERVIAIEERYKKQLSTLSVDKLSPKSIAKLQLLPGDEEILRAAFFQFFGRMAAESDLATQTAASAELISRNAGNGRFIEDYILKQLNEQAALSPNPRKKFRELLEHSESLEMLLNLPDTVIRIGKLLAIIRDHQKTDTILPSKNHPR